MARKGCQEGSRRKSSKSTFAHATTPPIPDNHRKNTLLDPFRPLQHVRSYGRRPEPTCWGNSIRLISPKLAHECQRAPPTLLRWLCTLQPYRAHSKINQRTPEPQQQCIQLQRQRKPEPNLQFGHPTTMAEFYRLSPPAESSIQETQQHLSLEQPRTKFMHTREPTTVQGYLERTLSDIAIMIAKVEQPLWRDGLITVLGNLHQLQQGNPIESSASLIANQCNRMEGILSKVTKSMSGNNTLHFQPLTTQNTPPTNSQQTPLEGGHTNLPQTSNNQQKGLYSSLFNDKSTHGSSRVIQPPKPSKKQLESKKKQQKRDKRLILIKESTESFENVNPLELRTNINAQLNADRHALSPVISTISKSMSKNLIITTTDDYSADLLIQNIDILAQHLKFKEAKRDTQFFKIVCHGVSLQFDRPDMPELIKNEITTFNKHLNLTIVGTPYWLTSEEKRRSGQRAGSLVIAFR